VKMNQKMNGGLGIGRRRNVRPSPLSSLPPPLSSGFTLIELLVTITIIGILAGMVLGALHAAGNAGREAATKSTITKLNSIIMQRYESYMTRRVPIRIPRGTQPAVAARLRLYSLRLLMRMEMPDSLRDITDFTPASFPQSITVAGVTSQLSEPALHRIYYGNQPTQTYESAQCLYKLVSIGSPDAMEQFNSSEIGVTADNKPVFVDGWGTPICWLRWAPGYSNHIGPPVPDPFTSLGPLLAAPSDIQTGNALMDPDPFDPRRVDTDTTVTPNVPRAFHLIPLICSAGADKRFGLVEMPISPTLSSRTVAPNVTTMFSRTTPTYVTVGSPDTTPGNVGTQNDNITNHHIEAR
jgi:prepilin-type N-terminal cleavage/methylation domain-containing protein